MTVSATRSPDDSAAPSPNSSAEPEEQHAACGEDGLRAEQHPADHVW